MKAVTYTKYGPPEVLQLKEIEKPAPGDNDVLIKVHAATVSAVDCTFRQGSAFFARLFTGPLKPKKPVPGGELAGEIVAVGKNVTQFKTGNRIFSPTMDGLGAHAEYVCLPQDSALTIMPDNMPFGEAAAVLYGFLTALPFIRDAAQIRRGQKVLINGASGGIGIFAVQLAKYFGAKVTGVCSTANTEMVKSLGADKVIDYKREDFTKNGETYDIIFDPAGKSSFSKCKNSLSSEGIYLTAALTFSILLQKLWTSRNSSKKAVIEFTGLRPAEEKRKDLLFFKELYEAQKIKPVIARTFPVEQIADAHRYAEQGHKHGSVVITF